MNQATKQTLSGLKQKCLNISHDSMVWLGASVSSLKLLFMSCLLMFNWPSTKMTWEGGTEGHEGAKIPVLKLCVAVGKIFFF